MQVRDFCSRKVVTVEPLASLREASLLMRNRHVGTLVVVERTSGVARPVGIRVCDVMQTRLALACESDGVFETVHKMRDHGVRRLPVVTADGSLAGIVSADDTLRVVAGELNRLANALRRAGEREAAERRPLDIV